MKVAVHYYEETDSTNLRAKEHLTHGTLILAEEQTGGRGRYGRAWESPKGNLYMSLVWEVGNLETAGKYAFISAIALAGVIKEVYGLIFDLSLKWPNDVLFKGKKLAGILLESEEKAGQTYLIIGIGVNLIYSPDYAVDLKTIADKEAKPEDVAFSFIKHLKKIEEVFEKNGFSAIRKQWIDMACGLGNKIIVRLDKIEMHGIFEGIDETGALILRQHDNKLKYITSGEVFFNE